MCDAVSASSNLKCSAAPCCNAVRRKLSVLGKKRHCHCKAWQSRGKAMPWQSHGIMMAFQTDCHGNGWHGHGHCHGNMTSVPWHCHDKAIAKPGYCHYNGMVLPYERLKRKVPAACRLSHKLQMETDKPHHAATCFAVKHGFLAIWHHCAWQNVTTSQAYRSLASSGRGLESQ